MRTAEAISDPLPRFAAVFQGLHATRTWQENVATYRHAAVAATSCPGDPAEVAARIRSTAASLSKTGGGIGQIPGPLRFLLGAGLVRQDETAAEFAAAAKAGRGLLRAAGLRAGGPHPAATAMVLGFLGSRGSVDQASVARIRALRDEVRRRHRWLVGPPTYPLLALLAGRPASPAELVASGEAMYRSLRRQGFPLGGTLFHASLSLAGTGRPADVLVFRFRDLARGFRARRVAIWPGDHADLALLARLETPPDVLVRQVLELRSRLVALRPRPAGNVMGFHLAAGLTFLARALRPGVAVIAAGALSLPAPDAALWVQQFPLVLAPR